MNFFSMLFVVLIAVATANRHSYNAHIKRITGVNPGHGGHIFGSKQISKCDKLRYKMMLKNRHRPDLVRQIYNLNLKCQNYAKPPMRFAFWICPTKHLIACFKTVSIKIRKMCCEIFLDNQLVFQIDKNIQIRLRCKTLNQVTMILYQYYGFN